MRAISAADSPRMAALSAALSRPENSGWKPVPSSRIDAIVPCVSSLPELGLVTPQSNLSSVLLPAPFCPTIPMVSPFATSNETRSSAGKTACLVRRVKSSIRRSIGRR